jgi:hypothetical protein
MAKLNGMKKNIQRSKEYPSEQGREGTGIQNRKISGTFRNKHNLFIASQTGA